MTPFLFSILTSEWVENVLLQQCSAGSHCRFSVTPFRESKAIFLKCKKNEKRQNFSDIEGFWFVLEKAVGHAGQSRSSAHQEGPFLQCHQLLRDSEPDVHCILPQ